jgi:chaperone modulatory protein CbpM
MTSIETIFLEFHGLQRDELERWISQQWVRPEGAPGAYRFHDIDIARIRLILELRDTMEVPEPALPTVLSLLDQLYAMRRRMKQLNAAMEQALPAEMRAVLLRHLGG